MLSSVLAGCLIPTASGIDLPDLGDSSETALSLMEEKKLGQEFMLQIREQRVMLDDLIIQEYLNNLGNRLVSHADASLHDFNFFMIRDNAINAFAMPGGYIGINAGLLTASADEGELAAVLAHEISHVTQRHLARRYQHVQSLRGPALAAMIAAVLVGGDAGRAAFAVAGAGVTQANINYTRKNEYEADRVGIDLLARSGFDPDNMATVFEKMQSKSRLYGGTLPEFLSTHPVFVSRIADARARAARYNVRPAPNSLEYRVAKARLQVLMNDNPAVVAREMVRLLDSGQVSDRVMAHYVLAMALMESGQLPEAEKAGRKLLRLAGDQMYAGLLLSEIAIRAGKDGQAIRRLQGLRKKYPDDHVLTLEYARLLIQIGKSQQAGKLLTRYLVLRSGDPGIYELLSHASKAQGDGFKSHVYMAEHYRIHGDKTRVISHLEAALRYPIRDYAEQSRVQALLKNARQQKKAEEKRADRY